MSAVESTLREETDLASAPGPFRSEQIDSSSRRQRNEGVIFRSGASLVTNNQPSSWANLKKILRRVRDSLRTGRQQFEGEKNQIQPKRESPEVIRRQRFEGEKNQVQSGDKSLEVTRGQRENGTVKWWHDGKGYGFVNRKKNGEDVFVHFSFIQSSDRPTLVENEEVEFEVVKGPKGWQAENVVRLEEKADSDAEPGDEFVALALLDGKLKVVALTQDGSYRFLSDQQKLFDLLYVHSCETRALRIAVEELEHLINDPAVKESQLQDFFERYPEFIKNDQYKAAHAHVVLRREDGEALIPDFVLEPVGQGRLCDILDLKLPSTEIFVLKQRRERFSAAVYEACAQLREYSFYFDDERNREAVARACGLLAYRPKMFVVIGRRGKISPIQLRKVEQDVPRLNLLTYDDLLERARYKLKSIK
jgi:cold shock CspA family protein